MVGAGSAGGGMADLGVAAPPGRVLGVGLDQLCRMGWARWRLRFPELRPEPHRFHNPRCVLEAACGPR